MGAWRMPGAFAPDHQGPERPNIPLTEKTLGFRLTVEDDLVALSML